MPVRTASTADTNLGDVNWLTASNGWGPVERNRSNGDDNRDGFELRRVQLNFGGHVVNPNWQYYIMTEGSRNGGAFTIRDAWIKHDFGSGWGVKAGQFKAPLLREELVSDSKHQAVERTLINSMFTVGRLQGIAVEYKGAQLADNRDSRDKQRIGELWARRSEGRCRFAWVTDRRWDLIEAQL